MREYSAKRCGSRLRVHGRRTQTHFKLETCSMQSVILGIRLRETSPAGGRKLRRAIRLPISNNYARHSSIHYERGDSDCEFNGS